MSTFVGLCVSCYRGLDGSAEADDASGVPAIEELLLMLMSIGRVADGIDVILLSTAAADSM